MNIHDKTIALVTGANKGLGFEISRQLAQKGIEVLLAARDANKGTEAAEKLQSEGLEVQFIKLDVTDSARSQPQNKKFAIASASWTF
jgi:NADP-dependent 3-hydroxy acid dehydrogenase YdfG